MPANIKTKQKLAIFDIDGTFFRWQLYHELIFTIKDSGLFSPAVNQSLEQALFDWKALRATWEDYELQVVKAAESELKNLNQADLIHYSKIVVQNHGHRVYYYTSSLAKKLSQQGYFLLAISGSHHEIVEIFSKRYGFNDCIGMIQKRDTKGRFVKGYERPVFGHKGKLLANYLADNPRLTLKDSYGVGDSMGDADLLQMVSNPIAFNPNQPLLSVAKKNGWEIIIERKNLAYVLTKDKDNKTYSLAKVQEF